MIARVTFLEWNHAPDSLRAEFTAAVQDYLRRSGEEITEREEWETLNAAMLGDPYMLLLAAVEGDRLLGFCLCRLSAGTEVTGPLCQVWQVYVWPGRARLAGLFQEAWPLIEGWGRSAGASRFVVVTRRWSGAYTRLLARLGFEPYSMIYQKTAQ